MENSKLIDPKQKSIILILLNISGMTHVRAKQYIYDVREDLYRRDSDSIYQIIPVKDQKTSVHIISTGKIRKEDVINFLKKENEKL
jgi:ABC-type uncharacterized transport system ATPase subunit